MQSALWRRRSGLGRQCQTAIDEDSKEGDGDGEARERTHICVAEVSPSLVTSMTCEKVSVEPVHRCPSGSLTGPKSMTDTLVMVTPAAHSQK